MAFGVVPENCKPHESCSGNGSQTTLRRPIAHREWMWFEGLNRQRSCASDGTHCRLRMGDAVHIQLGWREVRAHRTLALRYGSSLAKAGRASTIARTGLARR